MNWKLESITKWRFDAKWNDTESDTVDLEIKFRHPFTYNVMNEPVYLIKVNEPGYNAHIVLYQNGFVERWVKTGDANVND